MTTELIYVGEPGKFYSKVTVGRNFQTTLGPVPGEHYLIDDPGDGNWEAVEAQLADRGPVAPDTVKTDEDASTEAVED